MIEYKEQLYPTIGNWYYHDIKTEVSDNYRYLRYIEGGKAEKFYQIVKMLESFNKERNYSFCKKVLENKIGKEIVNVAHYGMPSINEVLIGVQKTNGLATILTSPGKNIFIVSKKYKDKMGYIPHGSGLELPEESDLIYHKDFIEIGGKRFFSKSIMIGKDAINRHGFHETEDNLRKYIMKIEQINELKVCVELKQVCSFSANGFQIWWNI